jgi:hypothetical protein
MLQEYFEIESIKVNYTVSCISMLSAVTFNLKQK